MVSVLIASGDSVDIQTGTTDNIPNAPELVTDYSLPGLKVVGVAVVDATGLQGAGFEIVEVEFTSSGNKDNG